MKNLIVSYVLAAAGLFTPLAGLHRFYLDQPTMGIVYLLTWGFFGIGTIIDLIRMPTLVDTSNLYYLFAHRHTANSGGAITKLSSPERAILKCANDNKGVVTAHMVALASGLSMMGAKNELDRLHSEGFCTKDVDENGNEIFEFTGLQVRKPL